MLFSFFSDDSFFPYADLFSGILFPTSFFSDVAKTLGLIPLLSGVSCAVFQSVLKIFVSVFFFYLAI